MLYRIYKLNLVSLKIIIISTRKFTEEECRLLRLVFIINVY